MKIIVATTFREFNSQENSMIQDLFLKSLLNQSYKNFVLVTTIFKEKNIERHLRLNYPSIDCVFHNSTLQTGRFSLTEVFINGLNQAIKYEDGIILWTTCDVILDSNFFEIILENFTPNISGTSHPHVLYENIVNYEKNIASIQNDLSSGIDTIFFDSSLFDIKENYDMINSYTFVDWGIFEHFLVAISTKISKNRVNIFNKSIIKKITNNRYEYNETQDYLSKSWINNRAVFYSYIRDHGLTKKFMSLHYCHNQFSMLESRMRFKLKFADSYLDYYILRHIVRFYKLIKIAKKYLMTK